ncbi:mucoidy inhibitor MuiA family protein [Dyadobacter diqingensis]|uniref:mucoidy inhibitor MuiA family protein n=1 Tax=Dyadobacter diqingensis TaxID=2938121 RepID=UPI0020C5421C|nr:mucoidy inhibitor MuiA family protein [Dyadobacter diqingensis]
MKISQIKTGALTLFAALLATTAFSQKTHDIDSKIKQVTLYRNGAEVTRGMSISLEEGLHELVFKNLSSSIDKESVRLSGVGDLTVLSILPRSNYNKEGERQKVIKVLEDQRDLIQDKLTYERGMQNVYKQDEEMLIKNQQIGGANVTLKTLDLKEAIDFQRKRLTEILAEKLKTANNIKKLEEDLKRVGEQLTPLQTEAQKGTTEVAIQISVKKLTQTDLDLTYYVADAGWYPVYDAKATNLSAPLVLHYKASVFQYSGEDWKKVKLTLSTANPRDRSLIPPLKTWYWGFPNDYSMYQTKSGDNLPVIGGISEVSGFVKDEENNALAGVSVTINGTNIGVATDANGFYQVSIPPNLAGHQRILDYKFIGYQPATRGIFSNRMDIALRPDAAALQEVAVAGYGGQAPRQKMVAVKGNNSSPQSIRLESGEREAATSVTYEIPVAYTLLSDGKTYAVDIKTENVTDSYYEYISIPKVKPDVYLNAYLPTWNNLSLLSGDVNLFLEDSYVGKTRLDVESAADTLSFSFGPDRSVIVQREQLKTFTKKQLFGNNVTENRAFKITVRNTKKVPVRIVVKDQFPLSKNKEVEVSDKSAPEAKVDDTTGEVIWSLVLPAGQSKELNLKYTVKYPRTGYVTRE